MPSVFVWAKPSPAPTAITMGLVDVIAPSTGAVPINVTMGYITIMDLYAAGPSVTIVSLGPDLPQSTVSVALRSNYLDAATHSPANSAQLLDLLAGVDIGTGVLSAGHNVELNKDVVYTGRFVIPSSIKGTAGNEIIIRSSGLAAMEAAGRTDGVRALAADSQYMAKVSCPSGGDNPSRRNLVFCCSSDSSGGAQYIRLIGLDIHVTLTGASTSPGNVIMTGLTSAGANPTSTLPAADRCGNIVFDRCLLHGEATTYIGDAIRPDHCDGFALINSRCWECHTGFGGPVASDGGSIVRIYNGPGPLLIQNNYLECSGITVMIGANPLVSVEPSDITIRRNYFTVRAAWEGDGTWVYKNHIESKYSARTLIEQNYFENGWSADQPRSSYYPKCADVAGNITKHATFRWNLSYNGFQMVRIGGASMNMTAGGVFTGIEDVLVENNLSYNMDKCGDFGDVGGQRITVQHNTTIDNNTGFPIGRNPSLGSGTFSDKDSDLTYIDNIIASAATEPFRRDGAAYGTAGLNARWGGPYVLKNNICAAGNAATNLNTGAEAGSIATGNWGPVTIAGIQFEDFDNEDFRLAAGSPYKNAATDGKDVGCDITTLIGASNDAKAPQGKLAGVLTGAAE